MTKKLLAPLAAALLLTGCATWSTSEVSGTGQQPVATTEAAGTVDPATILVTEGDITDRAYEVLGDVKVTVNKTTIFSADPTPELVNEELQEEAAKLGADAVIFARYGTVGVSLMSWGSLEGQGRAVAFVE